MLKDELINRYLKDMEEVDKYKRMLKLIDPFSEIREKYSKLNILKAPIITDHIINHTNIYNLASNVCVLPRSFSESQLQYISDFKRNIDVVNSVFRGMPSVCKSLAEEFTARYKSIALLEKVYKSTYGDFIPIKGLPTQRLIESVTYAAAIAGQPSMKSDSCVTLMLKSTLAYQTFIQTQLKHLPDDHPVIADRRIGITDFLGDIHDNNDAALESYRQGLEGEEIEDFDAQVEQNLYNATNSHIGFVYNPKIVVNFRDAVTRSFPINISSFGAVIIRSICNINESSQRCGKNIVFKPTSNGLLAASVIPTLIAVSEEKFGAIVDHLYFLLYEGSGGGSNRLVKLVEDDEILRPLWIVKHLRLGFRHDIEHGEGVPKKYHKIGLAYQELIGRVRPLTQSDWVNAQCRLYEMLVNMLVAIEKRV